MSWPRLFADPEFRQDAVETALSAGQQALEGGDSETAREQFHLAFEHARDGGQAQRAAGKLTGLGEQADVAGHLGLVVDWWLIGPFDAPLTSGYAREFLPHDRVDLAGRYVGQEGRAIGWARHHTADSLGLVNLAQAIAPAKEAVGYAYAELISPRDLAGQVRCGADDNCTVWLNGEKVFGREQWLNGTRFDRFIAPVRLRQGANQLLVKICQGPQHKDPQVPNNWSLQLRLCDAGWQGIAAIHRARRRFGGAEMKRLTTPIVRPACLPMVVLAVAIGYFVANDSSVAARTGRAGADRHATARRPTGARR